MKLALGTVQFGLPYGIANSTGRRVSPDEAHMMLQKAHALGIDILDTAAAYGESEAILGKFAHPEQKIVTKISGAPNNCDNVHDWVVEQLMGSLGRLQTDSIYGLLLHRPSQLVSKSGNEIFRALTNLKAQGLVKKIGISIYDPSELDQICGDFEFDLVQAPMNILDRRIIETNWAQKLREKGVKLHTRSTFLQGLLLIPSNKRPAKFSKWDTIFKTWDNWLAEHNLTPLQGCLRFVAQQPLVDRIIIGIDNLSQLLEIYAAINGPLEQPPEIGKIEDTRLINPAAWSQICEL